MAKGWFPTLVGYSAQGAFKFGLYEYFKDLYSNMAGEENSKTYKGIVCYHYQTYIHICMQCAVANALLILRPGYNYFLYLFCNHVPFCLFHVTDAVKLWYHLEYISLDLFGICLMFLL